jgi:hypothetical protein
MSPGGAASGSECNGLFKSAAGAAALMGQDGREWFFRQSVSGRPLVCADRETRAMKRPQRSQFCTGKLDDRMSDDPHLAA